MWVTPQWWDSSLKKIRGHTRIKLSGCWDGVRKRTCSEHLEDKEADFNCKRKKRSYVSHSINGKCVARVADFIFLRVQIEESLTQSANTSELLKKVQQRLYLIRELKKRQKKTSKDSCFPFIGAAIGSILIYRISTWFTSSTAAQKKVLTEDHWLTSPSLLHNSHCFRRGEYTQDRHHYLQDGGREQSQSEQSDSRSFYSTTITTLYTHTQEAW